MIKSTQYSHYFKSWNLAAYFDHGAIRDSRGNNGRLGDVIPQFLCLVQCILLVIAQTARLKE